MHTPQLGAEADEAGAEELEVDVAVADVAEKVTPIVVMFAPDSLVLRRSQFVRAVEAHIAAGMGPDRPGLAVRDKTSRFGGREAGA